MSRDFLNINRIGSVYRPVAERINDFSEVERQLTESEVNDQAKRCMECGIPFCHGTGCPLENLIPEINIAVKNKRYKEAWELLSSTSCMPEFTARVCPALCEASCCAGINFDPVMIRQLEKIAVERAFELGIVTASLPERRNGKKVAVIGSGPAGLAAAISLNKAGYLVTIFERNSDFGGLLRYGIPQFKLEKWVIDRRMQLIVDSGIELVANTEIGRDISYQYLCSRFDAVIAATGTPEARTLNIPGSEMENIFPALEYLNGAVSAKGRKVLVIGGGDTGSDCVGMAVRQGAAKITQIEIMPEPPKQRSEYTPWPQWPHLLRTSSSQIEGGGRRFSVVTERFRGMENKVSQVEISQAVWEFSPEGKPVKFTVKLGSQEIIEADIVFLALGFIKPEPAFSADNFFIAGDASTGQSLVVRAIANANIVAAAVHKYLGGVS